MTSTIRTEPRIPVRKIVLSDHPFGQWILRRRVDAWASLSTRTVLINTMEGFVIGRQWARSWRITERFQNNSVSRAVPRGPALLVDPTDEELLNANLLPILLFEVIRDRDSAVIELAMQFPQVNKTDFILASAQVVQSLDALQKVTT